MTDVDQMPDGRTRTQFVVHGHAVGATIATVAKP